MLLGPKQLRMTLSNHLPTHDGISLTSNTCIKNLVVIINQDLIHFGVLQEQVDMLLCSKNTLFFSYHTSLFTRCLKRSEKNRSSSDTLPVKINMCVCMCVLSGYGCACVCGPIIVIMTSGQYIIPYVCFAMHVMVCKSFSCISKIRTTK